MNRRILTCCVLAVFLPVPAVRAETLTRHWQFSRELRPADPSAKVVAAALDGKVYDASRPDLADLRVLGEEDGQECAYAIKSQPKEYRPAPRPCRIVSNEAGQERTVLVADLGSNAGRYDEVNLLPKHENFFRKIDLEGSDDHIRWHPIRKGMIVYSFAYEERSRYIERLTHEVYVGRGFASYAVWNLRFRFPECGYRYLRVTVPHDQDKEPVELRGLEVFKVTEKEAEEDTYEGKITAVTAGEDRKSEETVVDFGYKNLPLARVEVSAAGSNFFRRVRIEAGNDLKKWERAGEGTLFSVLVDDAEGANKTVTLAAVKCRYLKIIVENGDNKPVKLSGVKGTVTRQQIVLIPEKGRSYRLWYGNPKAKAVSYDVGELLKDKPLSGFGKVRLADESRNPQYSPEKGPWTEDKPYLLWAAMGGIMLGLLFLAGVVIKKVDKI